MVYFSLQEKECGELKVSVARCYPLKNRFADILPYDHTRVTLPSTRDDYINASHVQVRENILPVCGWFFNVVEWKMSNCTEHRRVTCVLLCVAVEFSGGDVSTDSDTGPYVLHLHWLLDYGVGAAGGDHCLPQLGCWGTYHSCHVDLMLCCILWFIGKSKNIFTYLSGQYHIKEEIEF